MNVELYSGLTCSTDNTNFEIECHSLRFNLEILLVEFDVISLAACFLLVLR